MLWTVVLLRCAQRGHQLEALNVLHHVGQLPVRPEGPWAERFFAQGTGEGLLRFWTRDLTEASETATAEVVPTVDGDRLPQGALANGAVDLIYQAGHRGS
jgi:hypothetical protein